MTDIVERLRKRLDNPITYSSLLDQAANEIERLRTTIVADTHILLSRRPVAWRVSYGAGGWLLFDDEQKAVDASERLGGTLMHGLYARDGK